MKVIFACVVLQSRRTMSRNCQTSRSNVLLCSVLASCVFVSAQAPELTPVNAIQTLFFIYTPAYCNLQLDAAFNEQDKTRGNTVGRPISRWLIKITLHFTLHSYLFIIFPFYFYHSSLSSCKLSSLFIL